MKTYKINTQQAQDLIRLYQWKDEWLRIGDMMNRGMTYKIPVLIAKSGLFKSRVSDRKKAAKGGNPLKEYKMYHEVKMTITGDFVIFTGYPEEYKEALGLTKAELGELKTEVETEKVEKETKGFFSALLNFLKK